MKRSPGLRFAYRLGVRLGIVNVERDIVRGLTAKQFRLWQHYATLEPFDEMRADLRAASIVQMIHAVNRGKGQKALTLKEAMLNFELAEEKASARRYDPQTPAEMLAVLKALSVMQNTIVGQNTPEKD